MPSFANKPRLPVIDLSLFDAGDPWRDHVAAQIDWASSEFGFFHIVGHGIESGHADTLLDCSRRFFAQAEAAKRRVEMSLAGRAWRGYFPVGAELTAGEPDLKEGLYFGSELDADDAQLLAGNIVLNHESRHVAEPEARAQKSVPGAHVGQPPGVF